MGTDHELDIQKFKNQIQEIRTFAEQKEEAEATIARLKAELKDEKAAHKRDVEDLDRRRIEATERLKKDMLYKIKENKQDLMALSDEQLHTTTRLTILENHRLTTELEYQSKQTEKLIAKNTQLEELVHSLRRDIEIHKEVESELAKRSQFGQKIIKKLNTKIQELETDIEGKKKGMMEDPVISSDAKMNEDLVRFLEQKLEETMNRMANLQMEHNMLKGSYQDLQGKLNERNQKYRNLGSLLADYLRDLQRTDPMLFQEDDMVINLQQVINTSPEMLNPLDRAALVTILLKQIQPYLSPSNLIVPEISTVNIVTSQSQQRSRDASFPSIFYLDLHKKPQQVNVAVQTSFALGTFDLPRIEIDAEMVKAPVRPWGKRPRNPRSAKALDTSYSRRGRRVFRFNDEFEKSPGGVLGTSTFFENITPNLTGCLTLLPAIAAKLGE